MEVAQGIRQLSFRRLRLAAVIQVWAATNGTAREKKGPGAAVANEKRGLCVCVCVFLCMFIYVDDYVCYMFLYVYVCLCMIMYVDDYVCLCVCYPLKLIFLYTDCGSA